MDHGELGALTGGQTPPRPRAGTAHPCCGPAMARTFVLNLRWVASSVRLRVCVAFGVNLVFICLTDENCEYPALFTGQCIRSEAKGQDRGEAP